MLYSENRTNQKSNVFKDPRDCSRLRERERDRLGGYTKLYWLDQSRVGTKKDESDPDICVYILELPPSLSVLVVDRAPPIHFHCSRNLPI